MGAIGTGASVRRAAADFPPAPAVQEAGHGEVAWDALFAPDLGLAIWTLLTFLTLLFVLGKYAWGPLLGALDARAKRIQGDIDEAKRRREEAEALVAECREQLADGRRRAQALVAEAREAAEELRRELEAGAREESRAILAAARREIERERDAAVEAVRREAVEVAIAAASRLLEERLDGDRDRKLVMDYIDDLARPGGVWT